MKKNILLVITFITFLATYSQTIVSGNQYGTWVLSDSPYEVVGEITIPNAQVLTIEAGVEINFQGHYKFNVDGKLLVNGTIDNMVIFTTNNTEIGWGGIRFDLVNEISVFNYCKMEYGKATGNYPDMHGGAVLLRDSNAEFYHCVFENNKAIGSGDDGMGGAIYGINTGSSTQTLTKFEDCLFKNNQAVTEGGAVKFTNDGKSKFTRCEFINNNAGYGGGAIMFYSALDVQLTNCLFYLNSSTNSGGGAIKALNPSVSLFFTNCTFTNNAANGGGEGGAIALDYADATFVNSIIYHNTQTYGDEINIGISASATINYCDVNMPSDAIGSNNLNNINPLFIDDSGDFHLQEFSPCIDAGTDVGLPYTGTNPDMGCYEYQESTSGNQDYSLTKIQVFPNPSQNKIHFKGIVNPIKISIIDILGKEVFVKNSTSNSIDISTIKDGIYFLYVWNEKSKISISKIIIKH